MTPIAIPSGTVTFLFTDIEGSTQRWEANSAAMAAALVRHDALLRREIEACGGHVFKTIGDAFCAAFDRPLDALDAAYRIQHALGAEDFSGVGGLRVRAAVHAGATLERDGDYFGPTLNRVARLLSLGYGGQVLVSGVAADLVEGQLPQQVSFIELGRHRLKDLAVPERVYQLAAPDLPGTFPALPEPEQRPNNLPLQPSPLVGRAYVVAAVTALGLDHRLVTLVGAGGVGKTRVALQVAVDTLDTFPDGAWLVELAPLGEPALLASAVATALGVRDFADKPVLDSILAHLARRRALIILDNCEHLVEEAAHVVAHLLENCPGVRIIATSREPLHVGAEQIYHIPSLSIPARGESLTVDGLQHYGASALFVERAKSANTAFKVAETDAPLIADICRALDGIPLAIELAAARVRALNVLDLGRRIDDRFRLLTGGSRVAMPRQQTLRALIDWSYNLLTEPEQRLFRRLSVFAGGWSVEGAERVCTGGDLDGNAGLDTCDLLETLTSLVDKSLVVADLDRPETRFHLLESMRAYAAEKLRESNEAETVAAAHAVWVASYAEQVNKSRGVTKLERWLSEFAPEIENVREALHWSLEAPEALPTAARIAAAMARYWHASGARGEGLRWVERALAAARAANADDRLIGNLLLAVSGLGAAKEAYEAASGAELIFERVNENYGRAASAGRIAWNLVLMGRHQEAEAPALRGLQLWRDLGMGRSWEYACDLDTYAVILDAYGRTEEARLCYAEVLTIFDALGDDEGAATTRVNLAELESAANDAARALEIVSIAAETLKSLGSISTYAMARTNAAAYHVALGNTSEARETAREALLLARKSQSDTAPFAIEQLAASAAIDGDADRAALMLAYVDAWYKKAGYERGPSEERSRIKAQAALAERLDVDKLTRLTNAGINLSAEDALRLALEA